MDTYLNGEGGSTTVRLAKILDIFELVDDLDESLDFKEVYSRHFLFEQDVVDVATVIELYRLDK